MKVLKQLTIRPKLIITLGEPSRSIMRTILRDDISVTSISAVNEEHRISFGVLKVKENDELIQVCSYAHPSRIGNFFLLHLPELIKELNNRYS